MHNTGDVSDTYDLISSSSQLWSVVTLPGPVTLLAGQSRVVTVTVSIPDTDAVRGLADTTVITATSSVSSTLVSQVVDLTLVPSSPPLRDFSFEPSDRAGPADPGQPAVYTHTLYNTGNVSDTYSLTLTSSRGWASVVGLVGGGTVALPGTLNLNPGQTAIITVTISVPDNQGVRGWTDETDVFAESATIPTLKRHVSDTTLVPRIRIFLPIVVRN